MKLKQQRLNLFGGKKGGRRPGSGRKRLRSKGVAHRNREQVSVRTPMHINFKYRKQIKNKKCLFLLKKAIINARSHGLRVIHFSLQSNHVHLIVESDNNEILSRGMRSLTVTFAKGLKAGRVQLERYHLHVLRSLKETRNAVHYVLFNQQKHEKGTYSKVDHYSSLLSLKGALELIKIFAVKKKMTILVSKREMWEPDPVKSYFLKQATA